MGEICNKMPRLVYDLFEKTNAENVGCFFKSLELEFQSEEISLEGAVLVLDGHAAHRSYHIKNFLADRGVITLFTPPSSSELNPIELIWRVFKQNIRANLLAPG